MKKIDAHAHIFERIASFGKCGELRPIGNGVCRWANGDEMAIIPKGYGDKEFMAETLLKIMDEEDVEKAILLQGSLYGFQNEYAMETAEKYPENSNPYIERCFPDMLFIASSLLQLSNSFPGKSLCQKCHSKH